MKEEKLVRDFIPAISARQKDGRKFRIAQYEEVPLFLSAKLVEEAIEVAVEINKAGYKDKTLLIEELADLSEVIESIKMQFDIGSEEIYRARTVKNGIKGSFSELVILDLDSKKID